MQGDPLDSLAAYVAGKQLRKALACPRVSPAQNGRPAYFIATCVHCDTESYHHLDPLSGPQEPGEQMGVAHCEDCGCVASWRILSGIPDGSLRVLGVAFEDGAIDAPET